MPQQPKKTKLDINGILPLKKPTGVSSNKAIQICKRLFNAKKVGHAGTLDPMATGLLVVLFGEATKFANYGLEADKTYRAVLKLGEQTTTGDAEGEINQTADIPNLSLTEIEQKLGKFLGDSMQIPPVYSALKHEGKKLYELALAGKAVEKPPRKISIYKLDFVNYGKNKLEFIATVSKGTYIRKLGEDFAKELGTVGHLVELERLQSGNLNLQNSKAIDLAELESKIATGVYSEDLLLPTDFLLQSLPSYQLSEADFTNIIHGREIKLQENLANDLKISDNIKLYFGDDFVGLGEVARDNKMVAKRLLNTNRFML